jgi:MFS family permease
VSDPTRKIVFQFAIVVFLVGSVLSGIAQSMEQLIAFRAIQGLGAGGLFVMALTIIGDILSPRERGRYQGYVGSVFALSSVAGPFIGGFFTDHLTWRWVFYINVPIGIAALIVTTTALNLPFVRQPHKVDYAGAGLLVAGVTALLLVTVLVVASTLGLHADRRPGAGRRGARSLPVPGAPRRRADPALALRTHLQPPPAWRDSSSVWRCSVGSCSCLCSSRW